MQLIQLNPTSQLKSKTCVALALMFLLAGCGGASEIAEGVTSNGNGGSVGDNDNDGLADNVDNCPGVPNNDQADSDNDGFGDVCDTSNSSNTSDGDNDGISTVTDNCPGVANNDQADSDNDGVGDACEVAGNNSDSDDDGLIDSADNCPGVANANQADADNDGVGDACDSTNNNNSTNTDTDNDGVSDSVDNCINAPNANQADVDNDGIGDACDSVNDNDPNNTDSDDDGYVDATDNCPGVPNPSQADTDNDDIGDACDTVNNNNTNNSSNTDTDDDGIMDNVDNCAAISNPTQADIDTDGLGDACDTVNNNNTNTDTDDDGIADAIDNCMAVPNTDQVDLDGDDIGDACDTLIDTDDDGIADSVDNCIAVSNTDQADVDSDDIGDACDSVNNNNVVDGYAATPNIVDSFGAIVSPSVAGPPWMAINSHYANYPPASGECSQAVHNTYWVQSPEDDLYYPTWHPAMDASGCTFGHEHGDDPRGSDLYDTSGGIPFGFVHSRLMNMGGMGDRAEDHVGHKVVSRDNWIAVDGNPVNQGDIYQELGTGFECDWLSKVHQGTHSSDALGNNLHEYFLNLDCADGTHVAIKELVVWGAPSRVFNECGNNNAPDPIGDPNDHPGLIDVGFLTSDSPAVHAEDPTPNNAIPYPTESGFSTNDGKREFGCFEDKINGYKDLLELWKPDGVMQTAGNGAIHFSPYYITKNSTRYVDPNWQSHAGWTNGLVNTVDMCIKGSRVWENTLMFTNPEFATNGLYPTFCALNNMPAAMQTQWENEIATIKASGQAQSAIDAALVVASEERRLHPDNPFDGSRRVSHPKKIQIYNNGGAQNTADGHTRWCSNAWGKEPVWPLDDGNGNATGDCPVGTIQQVISSSSNGWDSLDISGSSIGSSDSNGVPQDPANVFEVLVAPGIGEEWIRDRSGDVGIHGPN